MHIQSISNNYHITDYKNKNPHFGNFYIEPSKELVEKLQSYSPAGKDYITDTLRQMEYALHKTQHVHGQLSLDENKIPTFQVLIPEKLNIPPNGKYCIIDYDGEWKNCKIMYRPKKGLCTIVGKNGNKLELYNMKIKDGNRVFDIKDNEISSYNFVLQGRYHLSGLFRDRIREIDELINLFRDGRALNSDLDNLKYQPYANVNTKFWKLYNRKNGTQKPASESNKV